MFSYVQSLSMTGKYDRDPVEKILLCTLLAQIKRRVPTVRWRAGPGAANTGYLSNLRTETNGSANNIAPAHRKVVIYGI